MKKPTTGEGLLTTVQAARLADMSRQALLGHVAAGRLKPFSVATGRNLFSRSTVEAWLRQRKEQGINKRGPQPQMKIAKCRKANQNGRSSRKGK